MPINWDGKNMAYCHEDMVFVHSIIFVPPGGPRYEKKRLKTPAVDYVIQ